MIWSDGMRILFLSSAKNPHTVKWVNALSKGGYDVHLAFQRNDSPIECNIDKKVVLHQLRFGGKLGYYLNSIELNSLHKKLQPDVANAHYASGYGTLARLSKLQPLILSVWGRDVYDVPYESKFKMKTVKKNLLYAQKIASTSYCMLGQVKKLVDRNASVTPFGVDIQTFNKSNYEKTDKRIVIGNIKTLRQKYGISDLIKSIDILGKKMCDEGLANIWDRVIVYIYGDGEEKNQLINLRDSLKLQDKIEFRGLISHSEVPNVLKEFDIFCATSILDSESFGVSVVEAMSMELPVVVTDVDGFREVVEHEKNGIIVKRKDIVQIAMALKKLILDENLRIEFGQRGRKRVEAFYNWEKNVILMESLYEEIAYSKAKTLN